MTDGTNLYVGGDFTLINGMAANRIARWDGTNWWTLGAGIEGFGANASPGVYKMAFDANYRLYVAGNFNEAGSVAASHTAGWDGTNWFPLGGTKSQGMTHFDGDVTALLDDGTNLYAGGIFLDAGDVIVDGIAEWSGTNWQALGYPAAGMVPASTSTQVKALVEAGGNLYAGGSFTNIGGYTAKDIAMWDGLQWNNLGDADATVRALAFDGNYIWVGGSFTNIGAAYSPGLANTWPGGGWFNYGTVSGGNQVVNAIAVDGSDVYIGGNFTSVGGVSALNIIHWDGIEFVVMGSGVNNTVNAIAASNGVVYVGGTFTTAGGVAVNRIAQWNGSTTTWSALGTGVSGGSTTPTVSALFLQGGALYVAGTFTNAGGVYASSLAKLIGTNWFGLGSGLYFSVSSGPGNGHSLAGAGNDVFVGGLFTSAGDKPAQFISRWNDQIDFYPPPNLQLTRSLWRTNRQFQFRVAGTSGQSYVIEGSTNLVQWTLLLTNSATLYDFTDTNAAQFPHRVYRAILGP